MLYNTGNRRNEKHRLSELIHTKTYSVKGKGLALFPKQINTPTMRTYVQWYITLKNQGFLLNLKGHFHQCWVNFTIFLPKYTSENLTCQLKSWGRGHHIVVFCKSQGSKNPTPVTNGTSCNEKHCTKKHIYPNLMLIMCTKFHCNLSDTVQGLHSTNTMI